MNTKSILGILLVILALSLTLGAVSAEGNVTDDASADIMSVEETTVEQLATDSGNVSAAGGDVEASFSANTPVSDVGVKVTPLYDFDTLNTWSIFAYNLGPDDAANTQVFLSSSDNLIYFDHMAFDGVFDPITGIWDVGNLPANSYSELLLAMSKIAPGPSYIEAVVVSDSFDPNLSNNYDIAYFGLESASASEETLPATGNPLVVALLALFVVGVGGLKRRL